jgi:hypothetical protein
MLINAGTHHYTTEREKCLKEEIHQVKLCAREANIEPSFSNLDG